MGIEIVAPLRVFIDTQFNIPVCIIVTKSIESHPENLFQIMTVRLLHMKDSTVKTVDPNGSKDTVHMGMGLDILSLLFLCIQIHLMLFEIIELPGNQSIISRNSGEGFDFFSPAAVIIGRSDIISIIRQIDLINFILFSVNLFSHQRGLANHKERTQFCQLPNLGE